MGETVHRGGSASALATNIVVSATNSVVALANPQRNAITLYNQGATVVFAAYGAAAVASQGAPIAAGQALYEPDFTGTMAVFANGGTCVIGVVDVGFGTS